MTTRYAVILVLAVLLDLVIVFTIDPRPPVMLLVGITLGILAARIDRALAPWSAIRSRLNEAGRVRGGFRDPEART